MRTRILALTALLTLGCAGLTETMVELTTGGELEIGENGDVTMRLPDGTSWETTQGGALPEGFPLPPPWEGATPQAVVTVTMPGGETSYIASYEMERPRAELSATYADWLRAHGTGLTQQEETVAGMITETLTADLDQGSAVVTLTEAYGSNTVSLVWAKDGVPPPSR